jgi:hypothetical protein
MNYRNVLLSAIVLTFLVRCTGNATGPQTTIDMEPFVAKANKNICTDIVNKLFVIDDALVFWWREGSCRDASFGYTLFGTDTGNVLCRHLETIAGLYEDIRDSSCLPMFLTIINNLNNRNLGLGSAHRVVRFPF